MASYSYNINPGIATGGATVLYAQQHPLASPSQFQSFTPPPIETVLAQAVQMGQTSVGINTQQHLRPGSYRQEERLALEAQEAFNKSKAQALSYAKGLTGKTIKGSAIWGSVCTTLLALGWFWVDWHQAKRFPLEKGGKFWGSLGKSLGSKAPGLVITALVAGTIGAGVSALFYSAKAAAQGLHQGAKSLWAQ